jgi:hypothetical protein
MRPEPEIPFVPPPPAYSERIPASQGGLSPERCEDKVAEALTALPLKGLTYQEETDEVGHYGLWRFEGVTGRLDRRQIDQRGGPVFDLVQVYTGATQFLWAAAGVTIPPHYFVHDSASLIYYQEQGHGDEPYYLSYINGLETAEQVEEALQTPGAYRVSLSLNGPHVSRTAVDWASCLPADADACLAGGFLDRFLLTGNNSFIQTGHGPRSALYGFITFQMALIERLDLCTVP